LCECPSNLMQSQLFSSTEIVVGRALNPKPLAEAVQLPKRTRLPNSSLATVELQDEE
jgi:hypothetical protein